MRVFWLSARIRGERQIRRREKSSHVKSGLGLIWARRSAHRAQTAARLKRPSICPRFSGLSLKVARQIYFLTQLKVQWRRRSFSRLNEMHLILLRRGKFSLAHLSQGNLWQFVNEVALTRDLHLPGFPCVPDKLCKMLGCYIYRAQLQK
jgi:hypothetical protein